MEGGLGMIMQLYISLVDDKRPNFNHKCFTNERKHRVEQRKTQLGMDTLTLIDVKETRK